MRSMDPSAKIINVYPNPIISDDAITVLVEVLKDKSELYIKVIEPITGIICQQTQKKKYDKCIYKIEFVNHNLINNAYYIILETETNNDVWLINITK